MTLLFFLLLRLLVFPIQRMNNFENDWDWQNYHRILLIHKMWRGHRFILEKLAYIGLLSKKDEFEYCQELKFLQSQAIFYQTFKKFTYYMELIKDIALRIILNVWKGILS